MAESEHKVGTAIEPHSEEFDEQRAPTPRTAPAERATPRPGGSPFHIIKAGQGTYVRWGTAIGAGLLTLAGTFFISDQIQVIRSVAESYTLRTLIPVLFMLGMAYLIFWAIGRNQSIIDFMIATEGEMKKVNWSSKKEVWGATKVVIVTVFALGLILAIVDLVFILFFSGIGVIRMPLNSETLRRPQPVMVAADDKPNGSTVEPEATGAAPPPEATAPEVAAVAPEVPAAAPPEAAAPKHKSHEHGSGKEEVILVAPGMNWYVLRVASNKEDQVRDALERKVKIEQLEGRVGRVLVPTQLEKRMRGGTARIYHRKLYPGYVFVEMSTDDDGRIPENVWFVIKETTGVGDFIGSGGKPSPMLLDDVKKMLAAAVRPDTSPTLANMAFKQGDKVKVTEGPFENFEGTVNEINTQKGTVRVIVTIFGRPTPIEIEYWQVEQL